MTDCDLDTSVPDWVIEHPESLAVFQELGIDYTCGGKSLECAYWEQRLDVHVVLDRLQQLTAPVLASIQVSLPRHFGREGAADPRDRPWITGFFKERVNGPIQLRRTNLDGDGQADLVHHGGPEKAVLAYSAEHYPRWRQSMNNPSLPFGAFGENFTVERLTERFKISHAGAN